MSARNAHPTKKGPGRRHGQGVKHGKAPIPEKGGHWLGQRINEKRAEKARLISGSARQVRKLLKAARRQQPATGAA